MSSCSYNATIHISYPEIEFREYCIENSVAPDDDMLRSWLMQRAVDDELQQIMQLH